MSLSSSSLLSVVRGIILVKVYYKILYRGIYSYEKLHTRERKGRERQVKERVV